MIGLSLLSKVGTRWFATLVCTALLAGQAYRMIHANPAGLDPLRAQAADRIAERVAGVLAAEVGAEWSGKYVVVARLVGDPDDPIRSRIETELPARTNCRVLADTVRAELRDDGASKAARLGAIRQSTADAWKRPPVRSQEEAWALLRALGADVAVYGAVKDFRALDAVVRLELVVYVIDAAQDGILFQRSFIEGDDTILANVNHGTLARPIQGGGLRWGLWMLFVALLPILGAPFWTSLFDHESLVFSLACLVFVTALDGLLAWTLLGFDLAGAWMKVLFLLILLVCTVWNLFVLGRIERHRIDEQWGCV